MDRDTELIGHDATQPERASDQAAPGRFRLLIAQLQDDAPAGELERWARERGHEVRVLRPDAGEALPPPAAGDRIAVLGSDASVTAPAPWQPALVEWVRDADAAGSPVLGICFGGQLLAHALGGQVGPAARPERGWVEVEPAVGGFPSGPWMSWHRDSFEPPPHADVLARNPVGVQGFRVGGHLGLQFHPEVTAEIADDWAERVRGDRDPGDPDPEQLVADTARNAAAARDAAHRLFDLWTTLDRG